jgi:hypothetical protein
VAQLSRLYESAAAYVTDQPAFLNAAALVETQLQPLELLGALKQVEVGCPGWQAPHAEGLRLSCMCAASTSERYYGGLAGCMGPASED